MRFKLIKLNIPEQDLTKKMIGIDFLFEDIPQLKIWYRDRDCRLIYHLYNHTSLTSTTRSMSVMALPRDDATSPLVDAVIKATSLSFNCTTYIQPTTLTVNVEYVKVAIKLLERFASDVTSELPLMEQELKDMSRERYDMAMYRLTELERLNKIYFPEQFKTDGTDATEENVF